MMPSIKPLYLLLPLLLSACATSTPVAVSCPPPPPVPAVLSLPASTGPSLSERYDALRKELKDLLEKATKQP